MMRISVGECYNACMSGDHDLGDLVWTFQIISEIESANGEKFFVGMKNARTAENNASVAVFNSEGKSPDMGEYSGGYALYEKSRAKPKWHHTVEQGD